jgi:phosphoribosylglycinamide formyltransferase 1
LHKKPNSVQGKSLNMDSMTPIRLALFASGSGSNAENIIVYFSTDSRVEIALVVSNHSTAYVHERAHRLGVPSITLPKEKLGNAASLIQVMKDYRIDFIVLSGYMLKIPEGFVSAFPERIVNIHPALLPKFGGKGMYGNHVHEAVVAAKETESGITIHRVNENYDEGSILFQAKCPVLPNDSPEDVANKVHALEYRYYPEVIGQILVKEFNK